MRPDFTHVSLAASMAPGLVERPPPVLARRGAEPSTRTRARFGAEVAADRLGRVATRALALLALFSTGLVLDPPAEPPPAAHESGGAYSAASSDASAATFDRNDSGPSTRQSGPYLRISMTSS